MANIEALNMEEAGDNDFHAGEIRPGTQAFGVHDDAHNAFLIQDYKNVCRGDIRKLAQKMVEIFGPLA